MRRPRAPEGAGARLAAFAAVLLVVFGASFGLGDALGRDPDPSPSPHDHHPSTSTTDPGAPGPAGHDMDDMGS